MGKIGDKDRYPLDGEITGQEVVIGADTDGTTTHFTLDQISAYAGGVDIETDPVFQASVWSGLGQIQVDNWNDAFSWGDHADGGYLNDVSISDITATGTPSATTYLRGDGVWDEIDINDNSLSEQDQFIPSNTTRNITFDFDGSIIFRDGDTNPFLIFDHVAPYNNANATFSYPPRISASYPAYDPFVARSFITKEFADANYTAGGTVTNNNYNTIYTDKSGSTLTGAINDSNTVFTVSQGQYAAGSVLVIRNGVSYIAGNGTEEFTESNPATGQITFNTAPSTAPELDTIIVRYQVGTVNTTDTGQPDQTISIVSNELRLTRTGQPDSTADLTPYLGGGSSSPFGDDLTVIGVDYTALISDRYIVCEFPVTVTVPESISIKYKVTIINNSNGEVTVTSENGRLLNNLVSQPLPPNSSLTALQGSGKYHIL